MGEDDMLVEKRKRSGTVTKVIPATKKIVRIPIGPLRRSASRRKRR